MNSSGRSVTIVSRIHTSSSDILSCRQQNGVAQVLDETAAAKNCASAA